MITRTELEHKELVAAIGNNSPVRFDMKDLERLLGMRRAYKAGYINEGQEDVEGPCVCDHCRIGRGEFDYE